MDNAEPIKTPLSLAYDYTFIKLLGEGANGKTWLARSKIDGSLVAVKELKTSLIQDLKSLELFKREAETLKSISVPGVPRFYDCIFSFSDRNFNDDEENACYLIQEYVPYSSVLELLADEGKFTEEETLNVMEKLANILLLLQTQYSPPIIHRDIKPSNLLCEVDNMNNVQIALIDFGAVANPQKRSGGSTIAGTFGYMAPEQLQGDCCIQSDYYAMGATAVQMLTNVSPYNLPSDVFKLDYKPTLYREAPEVSKPMIEFLDYLLAPNPSERPKDAFTLLNAIKNVREGRSPHATNENTDYTQPSDNRFLQFSSQMKTYTSNSPEFLTTVDKTWITSTGIARGFYIKDCIVFIEYTYKYKDQVYVGFDSTPSPKNINYFPGNNSNDVVKDFPKKCTIAINDKDPRISCITFINGISFHDRLNNE